MDGSRTVMLVSARTDQTGRPGLCSTFCRQLAEPLPGTAVVATGWVVVEQPGPWGAKAATQSHLDPEFGGWINDACKKADLRFGLIRSPGKHSDNGPRAHQVFVASTVPGHSWLLGGCVADPVQLGIARPGRRTPGRPRCGRCLVPRSGAGRHSRCCSSARTASATSAARSSAARSSLPCRPSPQGRVWEADHLGGHRFAPTATLLARRNHARPLDLELATTVLAAADRGETVLTKLRGRTTWSKRGQVAEIAVRHLIGETGLDSLGVIAENLETVTVGHVDGRTWTVPVTSESADPPRPDSCGKDPFAMPILRAGTVTQGALS